MKRIMLLVAASAVMSVTLAVGAATAKETCTVEGTVRTCVGGNGGGGSFDADQDGTPDGGFGGGGGERLVYDMTNDNAFTISEGTGLGGSNPDVIGQPNGGYGHRCTGTINNLQCVGGSSPGL